MNSFTKEQLIEVLARHKMWLNNEVGGVRADLRSANLSYADLSYTNLSSADLSYADLSYTNLSFFAFCKRERAGMYECW